MESTDKVMRQGNLGVGLAIGVAIGAGLGVAMGNLALGIGLGIAIGVALRLVGAGRRKARPQRDPVPPDDA